MQNQVDSEILITDSLFIERQSQLAQLHALTDQAVTGRGAIALISGEAGIGKTSLLQDYYRTVPPEFVANWGGCDPLNTPRVLGPILDMRRGFGAEIQTLLDQEATSSRLVPAILSELENTVPGSVLVFEDVHWADNATLDLLKCIGRRVRFLPVVLVISYRSDEIDPQHPLAQVLGDFPQSETLRIQLPPISIAGVQALAQAAGKPIANLHEITGGNPFFVTELLAGVNHADTQLPASIQDAIGSRLNRLAPEQIEFLETVSVIPHAMDLDLITNMVGNQGELLAEQCLERKFLVCDAHGAFKFRHELARLGTKERVIEPRRRKIHEQAVAVLLSSTRVQHLEHIVYHASAAGLPSQVLEYAPKAARAASASGGHREAASHLALALQYVDTATDETAATLYENWSYEASLVRIEQQCIDARHKALKIWQALGRADKAGENLRWLSRLHWYLGKAELANDFGDQAIVMLESTKESAQRAMAYSLKSQIHMLNDRMDEAIEWGNKALAVERNHPSVDVQIHAKNNVGTALLYRDELAGLKHLEESLALALEHEMHEHAARVYTNVSDFAVGSKNFALAEKSIADGIVFDTDHDLDSWTYYLIGYLAQLRMEQGRLQEAVTISQGVVDLDHQTLLMKLPALLVLSTASMRLGSENNAELLQQALEDALSTGEFQYIFPARLSLVEAAWLNGDTHEAMSQIGHIRRSNALPASKWRRGELAIWMHRYGLIKCTEWTEIAHEIPEPFQLEIDGNYQAASDCWSKIGAPYCAALALLGDTQPKNASLLLRAQQMLEELSANGSFAKVSALADARQLSGPLSSSTRNPGLATRQHPLGLTKKEDQVLALLVDGLSNKEISQKMSRSSRTIENHVSSILKKLNVNNRMQAMLRLKNEPWLLQRAFSD